MWNNCSNQHARTDCRFRAADCRRIVTDGRRIFCRDSEIDHTFVRDVQLRAADLQPFIDRMQKIKLEALAPK